MSVVYFDANATTFMTPATIAAMTSWCNKGNASASYASAKATRVMMGDFRRYIGGLCNITCCCDDPREGGAPADSAYNLIFTSGASEANCMALQSIVGAYQQAVGPPHIVMSAIEHKSLIAMAESYVERGLAAVTFVPPLTSGHVRPDDVRAAMRPNTALVCVMHANNETGAINDVAAIGRIAHAANVPFHCDTVQSFGKAPLDPVANNIDSLAVSFHKLHGPPGVGALIIKKQLARGYKIAPMIFGTQNAGMRGGTENTPAIGAAFHATRETMTNRARKNAALTAVKAHIMQSLARQIPARSYTDYVKNGRGTAPVELLFLSGIGDYLPNTLMIAAIGPNICNVKLRHALGVAGVIVSVGSACNTASPSASHVLYAMGADEHVRRGAIRVSLDDNATAAQGDIFVRAFVQAVRAQVTAGKKD